MKKRQYIMTKREIDTVLNRIYEDRQSWSAVNKHLRYKILDEEIRRREFVLYAEQLLYKIESAKRDGNERIVSFNSELYNMLRGRIFDVCNDKGVNAHIPRPNHKK